MDKKFIREIVVGDYEQMILLWKNTPGIGLSDADTKRNISMFLERNPGLSFVYEVDKKIIGTVLCGHDARRGYIYHLAVAENFKKQGIGRILIEHCLEKLRNKRITKCHLFIFRDNEEAVQFYEHTGWKKRSDLLIYSKNL
ncbi:MAG: GNAT family N-acetyltransferase [Bacteroidetes bacterium]|nr:GNAT family N-acetyltransferase [Bacteroidota bacterium]